MHGKFAMKERKLLLVDPSDSGKTNWFSLFQVGYYTESSKGFERKPFKVFLIIKNY